MRYIPARLAIFIITIGVTTMTYRKVGGLHFVRIGRFGFSFFLSNRKG